MGVWIKRLFFLAVFALIGYHLWLHRDKSQTDSEKSGVFGPGSSRDVLSDCLFFADAANHSVQQAVPLLRPPVDGGAWLQAKLAASGAITQAESACTGGIGDRERTGIEDAARALRLMRTTMEELDRAAQGGGGALDAARRQEEIDGLLDRARDAMTSR